MFFDHARTLPYPDFAFFDAFLTQWTKLVDEDGTCFITTNAATTSATSRFRTRTSMTPGPQGFAALQGAEIDTILRHYLDPRVRHRLGPGNRRTRRRHHDCPPGSHRAPAPEPTPSTRCASPPTSPGRASLPS
ncbi:MAG: hypothetical protein R2710_04280 [Acidimicrobiales bacterium]